MQELRYDQIGAVAGDAVLNLIRRGADGSLRLSADRWRLDDVGSQAVVFQSTATDPAGQGQLLSLERAEVTRVTWDRLPKQQARSQLRFHLRNGDLLTFSGALSEPPP